MDATVPRVGHSRVKPSVYFSPTAQPISKRPATTRMAQFIRYLLIGAVPVCTVAVGSSPLGAALPRDRDYIGFRAAITPSQWATALENTFSTTTPATIRPMP